MQVWTCLFMKSVMMATREAEMGVHLPVRCKLAGNALSSFMADLLAPELVGMGSTSPISGKSVTMGTSLEVMDASTA
jgi:hypothetical protein